ncbi:UNVERIFIED_CONTAM: hypothetical protein FKN15_064489 [Acipenser sinensis]
MTTYSEKFTSGSHYWEVEVGGKSDWAVGIKMEKIQEREAKWYQKVVHFFSRHNYLLLVFSGDKDFRINAFSVDIPILPGARPRKVGVYLDCEKAQVSFYNADDMSHIYTHSECFAKGIAAYFNPGPYLAGRNAEPLTFGGWGRSMSSVPPQPVPPLSQTLSRYLRALEPLVTPPELEESREGVQELSKRGGLGERLQRSLEKRAQRTHNWVSDWWQHTAYLESRLPLPVHSNPAMALPQQDYSNWKGQLGFAAKLIAGVLDFKAKIDNHTLLVEYLRGRPLCMDQYRQIFSSCRVPGPKHDHVMHFAGVRRPPTHITVVRNFQFFQLEVYNSDGSPLTVDQIHSQLLRIRSQSWKTDKEPMGILTSEHRNTWGQAYNTLLRDRINRESVRAIERGIFTVCLDAPVMRMSEERYTSRMAAQMLHGGGTYSNSGNRWFDKTLQFIVGEDGACGLIYEQATAEGPPIATLVDHVLDYW